MITAEIRTLWDWIRGDCIECEHSHYNEVHHAHTQVCPHCGCVDHETLFSVFFVLGLKEYRRRRAARIQYEMEQVRKQREQRER